MSDTFTADDVKERLELDEIRFTANWAYDRLCDGSNCALVDLCPGDGTRYEIIVVPPQRFLGQSGEVSRHEYTVVLANCSGTSYRWDGSRMHVGYVTDKWVTDDRLWTGVVLTEFLNALADALGGAS